MNINEAFPTKWLSANDLKGAERTVTMKTVTMEMIKQGEDPKPTLWFEGVNKGLVLNVTNSSAIAMLHGPETDAWAGKQIVLYPTYVEFQGKHVLAIRVKLPVPTAATTAQAAAGNGQAVPPPAQPPASGMVPVDDAGNDIDDSIPW